MPGSDLRGERLQFFGRGCGQDFAIACRALVHAEAEIFGDERLYAVEEEIIEFGPGLTADLDGVFQTGGSDQRGARAFTFEQGVGSDGGAVEKDQPAFV